MLQAVVLAAGEEGFTAADVIGPYGALVGAVLVIGWLLKDRASERADKARVVAQRDALFDKLIETTGEVTETLATTAPILDAVQHELRLARERAG